MPVPPAAPGGTTVPVGTTGTSTPPPATTETVETTETETQEPVTNTEDTASDQTTTSESTPESKTAQPQRFLFHDPKDLPQELKPYFDRMQASFTKRMQTLSGVAKKAQAFDHLLEFPQFHALIKELRSGKMAVANTQDEGDEERPPDAAEGRIKEIVRAELEPERKEREQVKLEQEWNEFTQKYPFFENFKSELREHLEQYPQHTFEQSLAIVAFPELMSLLGDQVGGQISQKKRATITKPNQGASGKKLDARAPKTIHEAYELATRQLANSGRR